MTFLNCLVFSCTKNSTLDSIQKAIFMELFNFFQEYSYDNGTIFNKLSEE